jgi:hypothetical protein
VAVVPRAGSEHDRASARRLQRGRRPRDAAGRADVAGGERIVERRARGAPAAAATPDAPRAAAAAGENQRARSGAAVAGRARRVAAVQLARVVPPDGGAPPRGRIARRRRLGGPGRRGRGRRRRRGRAQAQRRGRRADICEDVRLPVGIVLAPSSLGEGEGEGEGRETGRNEAATRLDNTTSSPVLTCLTVTPAGGRRR